MGNKGSTESPGALTPVQEREENIYEDYVTPALSSITRAASGSGPAASATPPPLTRPLTEAKRPHGIERRSMTVIGRGDYRKSDAALRRLSTSDAIVPSSSDTPAKQENITAHIIKSEPQEEEKEVDLAASIIITFDRDVLTVFPEKLFEVKSELDPKPIQGHATYDPRTQKAEFIPLHALHPGTTYTIFLLGRALTTTLSSSGSNITSTQLTFHTCTPPPKSIGIKLRGQRETVEKLRITDFYDLYNSLVVWSTKQWGCSGEHIIGMYVEGEERNRMQPLKADHDVLRLRDDDVVVVDIKD